MIPLLSGGAYRRPGTTFQDFVPANEATPYSNGTSGLYQSSPPRIFPFIVSNALSYAIVIGTQRWSKNQGVGVNPNSANGGAYMQFYRATGNDNAALVSTLTNGGAVLPYRCKSVNVAVTNTDQCLYTRQGGPGAVANSGVDTNAVTIVDVVDSLAVYDDDIWSVQFCQANDVMFLTHPDYPPQVIYLNAPDDIRAKPWAEVSPLTGLGVAQAVPYLNQNSTAVTLKLTSISGNTAGSTATLTASAATFNVLHGPRVACKPEGASSLATDGAIFAIAVGEGNAMSGNNSDNGIAFVRVLSLVSSTVANVVVVNTIPSNYSSGTTTTSWWESAWSNYRGWPRACAIYQQRLVFAGTAHQPNGIWFTATGAFGAPESVVGGAPICKFTALGDGQNQGFVSGVKGTLANGQAYTTPANWVYYPVDDSQGDGQSTGPLGTQPFRISLATISLDAIQYLSADQQLFIGTSTQEWIAAPENGSFDVANSVCTIQSHYGSDLIQAIRIGYEMIFVSQSKAEILAYQYNYFDQSFFGEPVQLFFDEYPLDEEAGQALLSGFKNFYAGRRKYRQMDWDASRKTLWCVDTDGNLFGMTRDRKLQITAWHTHQLGGFSAATGSGQNIADNLTAGNNYTDSANFLCDGSVVSVCSTPNPLSGIRDIWMIVKRTYQPGVAAPQGKTIYSIERMVGANTVRQSAYSVVAPGNAQEPLLVDCAYFITDSGNPASFNYTVGAQLANASLIGTYYSQAWGMFAIGIQGVVDTSGNVSLQTSLPPDYGVLADPHTIVLGLPYNSIVQPVRVDPPSPVGTSQGAIKRISKAYVRLFKTLMLKVGSPPSPTLPANTEVVQWDPAQEMAQSPEIYTGDKEVFVPAQFDRNGYLYILQDQPLPFTLVSISLEGVEYEQ